MLKATFSNLTLEAGGYWLAVYPNDATNLDVWRTSPSGGTMAVAVNRFGDWIVGSYAHQTAFQILSTPEPASWER